jgi:hypothetical protein
LENVAGSIENRTKAPGSARAGLIFSMVIMSNGRGLPGRIVLDALSLYIGGSSSVKGRLLGFKLPSEKKTLDAASAMILKFVTGPLPMYFPGLAITGASVIE